MKTVYLILPGTRVGVSENGTDYRVSTLKVQMQFGQPLELTDSHAIFADGRWQLRVDRNAVVLSQYDGQVDVNQFGI